MKIEMTVRREKGLDPGGHVNLYKFMGLLFVYCLTTNHYV